MSSPGEDYLDWDRKSRISLPSKAADEYMIVSVREFTRLRERIDEALSPTYDALPAAYFALFGAALATGVAIPPLLTGSDLPSWVIPTFIVCAGSFFVLGVILVLVSHAIGKGQRRAVSEIVRDMHDLEMTYHGNEAAALFTRHRSSGTSRETLTRTTRPVSSMDSAASVNMAHEDSTDTGDPPENC